MKHLDLFSGIGGFALAAQWFWGDRHEVLAFCEQDPWARKVLTKHWPDVPCVEDVRDFNLSCSVDLLTGGWPCQDNSNANQSASRGSGLSGERTGLWNELIRIMGSVRPRWAILENVSNVLRVNGGLDWGRCLHDLAEIGYDAEWGCFTASMFGAPHHRERVFVVAYPAGIRHEESESILGNIQAQEGQAVRRVSAGAACMVGGAWDTKPPICGVDDGGASRSHRYRGLGNAVVPQVALRIMEAIREADATMR